MLYSLERAYNNAVHIRHDYQNFISNEPDENLYFSEQYIEPIKNACLACCRIVKKRDTAFDSIDFIPRPQNETLNTAFQGRNESWMTQMSQMIEKSSLRSLSIVEISCGWKLLIINALVLNMHNMGHVSMRFEPLWKYLDSTLCKRLTSVR